MLVLCCYCIFCKSYDRDTLAWTVEEYVRSEVLMAVTVKIIVFYWDAMLCRLKSKAANSPQTLVTIC
jgi:hypothetical protein